MAPSPLNRTAALRSLPSSAANVDVDQPQPLSSVTLHELLERDFPPRENLLAPWLPAKGLAMVFAPRGVGKTHFSLGVAYAVASGGTFLGWKADQPRKVLLIDGELPAITLQERLAGIVQHSPEEAGGEFIRVISHDLHRDGLPDISTVEGQERLEPLLLDAELIVLDNLSTLARSGKENESESWACIQSWALRLRQQGRSVLFVHHAGKGGEQRGTSKREDVLDTVVKLSHPSDYSPKDGARFVVEFTKSRGFSGPEAEAFEAAFRDGAWSTATLADVRAERILELHGEGLNQRDIAQEVGCSPATVNRTIKKHKEGA